MRLTKVGSFRGLLPWHRDRQAMTRQLPAGIQLPQSQRSEPLSSTADNAKSAPETDAPRSAAQVSRTRPVPKPSRKPKKDEPHSPSEEGDQLTYEPLEDGEYDAEDEEEYYDDSL